MKIHLCTVQEEQVRACALPTSLRATSKERKTIFTYLWPQQKDLGVHHTQWGSSSFRSTLQNWSCTTTQKLSTNWQRCLPEKQLELCVNKEHQTFLSAQDTGTEEAEVPRSTSTGIIHGR